MADTGIKYRPDIDGLRAIAVVPVLLYHAGVNLFSGGFVGVDVFFVISGYLITRLIWREIQQGRFSIVKFYERRARRILPALFVVMALSTFAAYRLFMNDDLRDFSSSLAATAAFLANFHFLESINYFAAPAEVKPLLHTWSLAIEEQFYIVFPLILLGLWRFNQGRIVHVLMGVFLLSFVVSTWMVGRDPNAAFYLPQSRAWELLLGCLLALGVLPTIRNEHVSAGISAAGLALILLAVFAFDQSTPFPGLAALLPCLGAAAIIWSAEERSNLVARLLSMRVFVGIGLISYSLYLWHWPLIVFAKYYLVRPLLAWESLAVVIVSFLLAWLSWRYVEQPFRSKSSRVTRPQLLRWATTGVVVFLALGLLSYQSIGFANRKSFWDQDSAEFVAPTECLEEDAMARVRSRLGCWLGPTSAAKPEFIVWGDSHVPPLLPVLDEIAWKTGKSGVVIAKPGCRPLLGLERKDIAVGCAAFNQKVLEYVLEQDIRTIVLASRWNVVLGRPKYELGIGEREVFLNDSQSAAVTLKENRVSFERAMSRTLKVFQREDRRVFIVLQAPYVGRRVPQYLARRNLAADEVRLELEEGLLRHQAVLNIIKPLAQMFGAELLDPANVLCEEMRCLIASEGRPLYKDDDHLSLHGGAMLGNLLSVVLVDDNRVPRTTVISRIAEDASAPVGLWQP